MKTLKDIEITFEGNLKSRKPKVVGRVDFPNFVGTTELRRLAINEIKKIAKIRDKIKKEDDDAEEKMQSFLRLEGETWGCYQAQINWIAKFFNITEEDLK